MTAPGSALHANSSQHIQDSTSPEGAREVRSDPRSGLANTQGYALSK